MGTAEESRTGTLRPNKRTQTHQQRAANGGSHRSCTPPSFDQRMMRKAALVVRTYVYKRKPIQQPMQFLNLSTSRTLPSPPCLSAEMLT